MKKAVILVIASCFLAGCVSVGRQIDQSAAAKIEKGKTTREEVIRLIGSPDRVTITSQGDTVFMYSYTRATAKPATFIPVVGALAGGANVQHQMYMVTFGSDGIVKNFVSTYGATESDTGLATGSKAQMPDVEETKRTK